MWQSLIHSAVETNARQMKYMGKTTSISTFQTSLCQGFIFYLFIYLFIYLFFTKQSIPDCKVWIKEITISSKATHLDFFEWKSLGTISNGKKNYIIHTYIHIPTHIHIYNTKYRKEEIHSAPSAEEGGTRILSYREQEKTKLYCTTY